MERVKLRSREGNILHFGIVQLPPEDIYVDPLIMAISADKDSGVIALRTIGEIRIINFLSHLRKSEAYHQVMSRTFCKMLSWSSLDGGVG